MTTTQNRPTAPDQLPQPLRVVRVMSGSLDSGAATADVRVELSRPLTDLESRALELLAARARPA